MKQVTITKEMLVWCDERCGLYKSPQGHVLVEYATGEARWMSTRWAKSWLKTMADNQVGALV